MANLGVWPFSYIVSATICFHAALGGPGLTPPLHAEGRYVVDATGNRVKLACTAWAGAHTMTKVPGGLPLRKPEEIAALISSMGLNCVRLPYSTEAYLRNPVVRTEYIAQLPNSTGQTFLNVLDQVVAALTAQKLMVILNNHNTGWGWCCGIFDGSGVWFNKDFPETSWLESLRGLSRRYRDNPWVVGYDIRNEPRPSTPPIGYYPVWGDTRHSPLLGTFELVDWRAAAERASAAVLEEDPSALVIVELLHFSQYLCPYQLEQYPLRVPKDRIVWSPHEFVWFSDGTKYWWYGCDVGGMSSRDLLLGALSYAVLGQELEKIFLTVPMTFIAAAASVCLVALLSTGRRIPYRRLLLTLVVVFLLVFSLAAYLKGTSPIRSIESYDDFAKSRDAAWGHILLNETGPVWIGEFGEAWPSEYWIWLMRYMKERDVDFSYWVLDGERFPEMAEKFGDVANMAGVGGRWEFYGLMMSDYKTYHHPWKVQDLQYLMGQRSNLSDETLGRMAQVESDRLERREL